MRAKAKVNYANGLFWLAPQLSSYFRGQKYGYSPFKNLVSLVKQAGLERLDLRFSFNRLDEACYGFFNDLWRIKGLAFRLNDENLKKIAAQGCVEDATIHPRLIVRWDEKSLKSVRKGNIPFYSPEWFRVGHVPTDKTKTAVVSWIKKDFELLKLIDAPPEVIAAEAEAEAAQAGQAAGQEPQEGK